MILTNKQLASIICATIATFSQSGFSEDNINIDEILSSLTADQTTIDKDYIGIPRLELKTSVSKISHVDSNGRSLKGDNTFRVAVLDLGFNEDLEVYDETIQTKRGPRSKRVIKGHGTLVKDIIEQYAGKDGKIYSSENNRRIIIDEISANDPNVDINSNYYGNPFAAAVDRANKFGAYDYINLSGGTNSISDFKVIQLYNAFNPNSEIQNSWGDLSDDEKNKLVDFYSNFSISPQNYEDSEAYKNLIIMEVTRGRTLPDEEIEKLRNSINDKIIEGRREAIKKEMIPFGHRINSIKSLTNMGTIIYMANGNRKGQISAGSLLTPQNNSTSGKVYVIGALDKIQSSNERVYTPTEVENNNLFVGFLGQSAQKGGSTRFAPAIAPYQLVPELVNRYPTFKDNNYSNSPDKQFAPVGASFATPFVLARDLLNKAGWSSYADDQEHIKSIVGPDDEESDGYLYIDPRK